LGTASRISIGTIGASRSVLVRWSNKASPPVKPDR
jgi:hypothetical protein